MRISDWSSDVCSSDLLKRRCKDHKGEDRAGGKLGQAAEQAAEIRNRGITDQAAQADAAVIEQALRHQIAKIAVEQPNDRDQADHTYPITPRDIEAQPPKGQGNHDIPDVSKKDPTRRP